jgi:hypothetical protein
MRLAPRDPAPSLAILAGLLCALGLQILSLGNTVIR